MKNAETGGPWGFTLVEMIVTVIVLGILAMIALPRFVRVVEKSRSAEARNALGVIRDAEIAYYMELDVYTNNLANLKVLSPTACNATYFFSYAVALVGSNNFRATATRCAASGRPPQTPIAYQLTLDRAGNLNCSVPGML